MKPKILITDDEVSNLQLLRSLLTDEYQLFFAKDGKTAIQLARLEQPNLILLDIVMPEMSGLETCYQLKNEIKTKHIPVIFISSLDDIDDESLGFEVGGVDYINKPIKPATLKARIKTHLALVNVEKLHNTQRQIIKCLGRAGEYKDDNTGQHTQRMSAYAKVIAHKLGYGEDETLLLGHATAIHDVGKIGIPDDILLKPGPLTSGEWEIMKTHVFIGVEILGDDPAEIFEKARNVALYHHEKWDGTGYPEKLEQEDIPIEARITSIADVFDALTHHRPYKKAWSVEQAVNYMKEQRGKHFDPKLLDIFLDNMSSIVAIKENYSD